MNAFWARLAHADWKGLPARVARQWRRSLQFRTVITSMALSGVAIILVGVYMSFSISNDLFASRLDQVLGESQRAQVAAQRIFDSSDATDRASVQSVMNAARTAIRDASSSGLIAVYRVPGQESSAVAPQNFTSPELTAGVITESLRASVESGGGAQSWQSTSIPTNGRSAPGLVVGTLMDIPGIGAYELYIGYDLVQAEETLQFIQQVLWISGLGLLLLVGAIAWVVARLVVSPIRFAAETSERLAAGDLAVRLPEKGEDVVATLARSFNHMADSMQGQLTELAELSVMQQRFVSDVSHELRTPLTTIRLAGDMLYDQREDFDATTRRTTELLHTQVQRFDKLLADLLEISRYDAGSVELETEPTNVVQLTQDIVGSMTGVAERYGSELSLRAPGGHFEANVDPRRVRRIVTNLIGNAIEHGEGKPIEVEVDSNATSVAIAVRDYGVGMSEDQMNQAFSRFWRADPSRKRTLGGTGLGLAISLEDTRVHHGTLDVWASPGLGARFRLTLPRSQFIAIDQSPLSLEPLVPVVGGDET
ncbi:two-component system sensor histidine kinase MtrB [Alpinimonas psychrophila]|uniref:Sensor histidine kinase MtrB n=1 Tax=Alpinimonas psychrophila TaxID=748908 RepID=A0A7W3PPE7_9MICO|nr:MtrAB system histidine kinase MtrB [Alpinimonas psychrophila]MBA8829201.1 two-component system sensor histidine kinase MtrB [Alpinimonas psychrophila]